MINLLPRIVGHGDLVKAKMLLFFAKKQLNILHGSMQFQKLKQSVRRLSFPDGTNIVCNINHGISQIDIFCPVNDSSKKKLNQVSFALLTIIYGDPENKLNYTLLNASSENVFIDEDILLCGDGGHGIVSEALSSTLYGDFILCHEGAIEGETSGAEGMITDCLQKYYEHTYLIYDLFVFSGLVNPTCFGYDKISAFDISPLSNTSCMAINCSDRVLDWWSKTYDEVIVTAFIYLSLGCFSYPVWSIAISYKNKIIKFPSGLSYEPSMGNMRFVCTSRSCESNTNTHIGFDIYSDAPDVFYVGFIGDQEATLNVYKINIETMVAELHFSTPTYVHFSDAYIDILNNQRHVRLVGYGYVNNQHEIEYAAFGYSDKTIKYIITDNGAISYEVTTRKYSVITGLWNPVKKEAYYVTQDYEEVGDPLFSEIGSRLSDTVFGLNVGFYCGRYNVASSPAYLCPGFDYIISGWPEAVHIFDGACITSISDYYSGAQTIAWLEYGVDTDYGDFLVNNTSFSRGAQTLFIKTERVIGTLGYTEGSCNGPTEIFIWYNNPLCISTAHVPLAKKDYLFLGGVFNLSDMSYKYKEINYVEMELCNQINGFCDDEKNTVTVKECKTFSSTGSTGCYSSVTDCDEYNWIETIVGDITTASISDSFPYDEGWKSILLHGKTVNSNTDFNVLKEISNWIIYKNLTTNEFYVVDDSGILQETISAERAFFKQQEIFISLEE